MSFAWVQERGFGALVPSPQLAQEANQLLLEALGIG